MTKLENTGTGLLTHRRSSVPNTKGHGSLREREHILRQEEGEQAQGICLTEPWMDKVKAPGGHPLLLTFLMKPMCDGGAMRCSQTCSNFIPGVSARVFWVKLTFKCIN